MPMSLPPLSDGPDLADGLLLAISPWDDARALLLMAVNSATTSIRMCVYGLSMDALIDALIAKAESGVRVAIVLDHTQSTGPTERPVVARLVEAARHTALLTVVIATSPMAGQICHIKAIVIDGEWVCEGSLNFTEPGPRQVNTFFVLPSRKLADRFSGRISALEDWALTHEQRYQVLPAEATLGAAPPEGGDVAPTPRTPHATAKKLAVRSVNP